MVKIRYSLAGRSGQRLFYIVVIDSRKKRDSKKYLEKLGFYNPYTKKTNAKKERIQFWINRGAQLTKTCQEMLKKQKLVSWK